VKQGADVKQNSIAFSLHSSGHPSRQELRLMLRLANPHYFMPAHGEYRMLKLHGQVAQQLGMSADHIFICDNGDNLVLRTIKSLAAATFRPTTSTSMAMTSTVFLAPSSMTVRS
jgi:mRNA degradation ribonuclease J1/J2